MERKIWIMIFTIACIAIILAMANTILYFNFIAPDADMNKYMLKAAEYVKTSQDYLDNNGHEIVMQSCSKHLSDDLKRIVACDIQYKTESRVDKDLIELHSITVFLMDSEVTSTVQSTELLINDFEDCKKAGHTVYDPDCFGCHQYCTLPNGTEYTSDIVYVKRVGYSDSEEIATEHISKKFPEAKNTLKSTKRLDCQFCYNFQFISEDKDGKRYLVDVDVRQGFIEDLEPELIFERPTIDYQGCLDAGGKHVKPSCSCKKEHCILDGQVYYR